MNFLFLYCAFYQILLIGGEIPASLHNYIISSNRLKKYYITLLVEYDKNSTERLLEERLYFGTYDNTALRNHKLNRVELEVAVCAADLNPDQKKKSHSIAVLEMLQHLLQFRIKYTPIEYRNEEIFISDDSFLPNNTYDLILCYPNMKDGLLSVLYPTLQSSYVLVYKGTNLSKKQDIFILTFAGSLWLCFILVLVVLGVCLTLTSARYRVLYGHPTWGTVDITFWGIAAACQQGLSTAPSGFASRTIFFLGYLTSYLLYTGFAAGITSLLAGALHTDNYDLKTSDIQQMNLKVAAYGNVKTLPSSYDYLRKAQHFRTLNSFLFHLSNERSVGVTDKILLDRYFSSEERMFEYCDFTVSELKDAQHPVSFLVPRNFPYKKLFNYWLLRLEQTGVLNLTLEHTRPALPPCAPPPGYSSATLDHVASAVLLLVTGLTASLLFLLAECLWHGYKHRVSTNITAIQNK